MQLYAPQYVISAPFTYGKFDGQLIKWILSQVRELFSAVIPLSCAVFYRTHLSFVTLLLIVVFHSLVVCYSCRLLLLSFVTLVVCY